jgi:serine/threonine-protein kinase
MVREDGDVMLTDFGIARAAGNDLTGAGLVVGTACYIAPEQAAGRELTPAVDIYSLGVTAYECLTGRPPFLGDNPMEVARQHITSTPRPLPSTLPRPVRDLVGAMLAKDPARRPTAAAVAAAARVAAAGQVAPQRRWDWDQRRRGVLVGAVTGVTLVLATAALAAFGPGAAPGSASAPIPNVVDATEAEAVSVLGAHGFVVEIVSGTGPRCVVVAQHPPAGQTRQPGSRIMITVERDRFCPA